MAYAIVQKELVVPELDQLKRAFKVSPNLTDIDAQTAVNGAYGILLRGLDVGVAKALHDALLAERLETEIVEESKLPVIPPAKIARQAEFHPSHLTLYDPMRRPSEISWTEISFIAAGYVRMREGRKQRAAPEEPMFHGAGITQDTVGTARPREEEASHMLVDIFLSGGTTHFSLSADEFAFDHLGTRLSDDLALNYVALVQDFAEQTPHAGLNRGAFLACQEPPELFPYPSKAAFNEEVVWMLWRIGQLTANEGASG